MGAEATQRPLPQFPLLEATCWKARFWWREEESLDLGSFRGYEEALQSEEKVRDPSSHAVKDGDFLVWEETCPPPDSI